MGWNIPLYASAAGARRRASRHTETPMRNARPATPPRTPPTIALTLELCDPSPDREPEGGFVEAVEEDAVELVEDGADSAKRM